MKTDRTPKPLTLPLDIPTYVADIQQRPLNWLVRPLEDAGLCCIETLADLDCLGHRAQQYAAEGHDSPALVLLAGPSLNELLIERCHHFRHLTEQAILGVVLVVYGRQSDSVNHAEHCLDIIHLPNQKSPDKDTLLRLQLAIRLLQERRDRLAQERAFNSRFEQHRITEEKLVYLASHDELTGLANRNSFESALDDVINAEGLLDSPFTLLYIDLDRFKLHNDIAGHHSGNYLLKTVANLMLQTLPGDALLARLGSDEFAALLPGRHGEEGLHTAEQLRARIAAITPDGDKIIYHIGISIGLATIQSGTVSSASQALARAEQACYVAKTQGGNTVHRYSHEDNALLHMHEDMHWAQPFHQALNHDELFLNFQPILDVRKREISHYEVLVRLPRELGGDEESAHFMLTAERLGLAQQIDLWVINKAIDYLVMHPEISLAINLSSHAFQQRGLLTLLDERLQSSHIDPGRLIFEITETASITNFSDTRRMVTALRELGCRFALDDFGSGFSSYHYIKQFPIDILKIDGSFITNLLHDQKDRAIVQSMIEIAHSLGKEVVAEFIENAETLGLLIQMGIDHAQGYYIGHPLQTPSAEHHISNEWLRQPR